MSWLLELIPAALGLGSAIVKVRREKLRLERERFEEAKRCKAARPARKTKS